MARMLGRGVWYGVFCSCCNGPRSVKVEKLREKRDWRRELRPEVLLPTPMDDPADCLHGCNGDCLEAGSDRCNFTCHPVSLRPENHDLWDRMDRRALELLGEEMLDFAERTLPLGIEALNLIEADTL